MVHCLTTVVPCNFFSLPTCGNGIRCCSDPSCVGELGTDSSLENPRRKKSLAGFVGVLMGMVIFSGIALPLRLFASGTILKFVPLLTLDRSSWPRCLAWHGWLPCLSARRGQFPWAVAEVDNVDASLESALGAYPAVPGGRCCLVGILLTLLIWLIMSLLILIIWTDGSRDEDLDAMVGVAGAGAFVKEVPWVFDGRAWGHAQDLDLGNDATRIFSMVPGILQTVSVLNTGGLFLLCRPLCLSILELTIKMSAAMLVGFSTVGMGPL